jgi:enoyl-CoA hydratase
MIETAIDDRLVATVTVNNPEQRNALGNAGKRELAEAIERVGATDGLRVVIVTGAGDKSFIGGANLKEMAGFVRHAASEGPTLTHRICDSIRRTPVPVIARINGWCLGAGLEIAAACDMRAAVATARFHIDCAEAMQCHLIERMATPGELDQAVEGWVAAILAAGPNAIRSQKELIRDWERMSLADAVQQGIRAVAAAHGSDEPRRLMQAFAQRKAR